MNIAYTYQHRYVTNSELLLMILLEVVALTLNMVKVVYVSMGSDPVCSPVDMDW